MVRIYKSAPPGILILAILVSSGIPTASYSASDKFTICHNGNTTEVRESDLSNHIDHGDTIGSCALVATVNCPVESITEAINKADAIAGQLTIEINGICQESVVIRRDRVVLHAGPGGGGIDGDGDDGTAIFVTGAADVEIIGLEITGTDGVFGDVGAGIRMQDCTIDVSGVGFGVQRGSSARIRDSEITGASVGVEVGDSSGMRTDGTVTMTSTSQFGSALDVFRSASADLRGTVIATNTGGGPALGVTGTSTVRNRSGLTTLQGDVAILRQSHGELRNVAVVGNVFIVGNSTLEIRQGTVDGDVDILSQALFNGGSLNVTGTIECAPFQRGYVAHFGGLTAGSIVGCPVQCSVDADCSSVGPGSKCLWGRCTF
jgi:hypothetical protein